MVAVGGNKVVLKQARKNMKNKKKSFYRLKKLTHDGTGRQRLISLPISIQHVRVLIKYVTYKRTLKLSLNRLLIKKTKKEK